MSLKLTSQLHIVPRSRMVELYLHSPICMDSFIFTFFQCVLRPFRYPGDNLNSCVAGINLNKTKKSKLHYIWSIWIELAQASDGI
jgi:hypothetical protein